ncbi:MAG TPA: 50S ribosomal protein L25 [Acidimicrobiia bacterium]|nr:50S ribosomal protein L25 [Acidimicrobiia bacterium]
MREVTLVAEPRPEKGSAPARRLRRSGKVPAVVYGLESEPVQVSVSQQEMMHVIHRVGVNALINLEVDGSGGLLTMAREVQRHPIKGDLMHIDFVRIRADVAVQADVAVHVLGEPIGAKEGGVLEHVLFTVSVSAKPREIPENFEIDVSDLGVGDAKRVSDLDVPEGVEILNDPEAVVVNCLVPRISEEAVTLSAEELAQLEGLSDEELSALRQLAAAKAGDEGEGEGDSEGGDSEGGDGGDSEGGDGGDASGETAGDE